MRQWEQRCVSLLQESEPSATYLRNRQANGASRADRQFLSRPAVLLAVCRQLERDRNYRPLEATAQATSAFIATGDAAISPEELAYLRADLSQSAAVSECHIGNFEACSQWILTARALCAQTSFPSAVLTCLAVTELMSKHCRHFLSETLEGIDSVLVQASGLGIEKAVLALRVLRAHTLKDLRRFDEAAVAFSEINAEKLTDDPLMRAAISVGLAETQQMLGDLRGAVESCRRASILATQSDAALGWGMLHASVGQILLNSGQPDEGLRELDRSIEAYGSGGLVQLQTYIMITSAEILLRLGHKPEGVAKLLGALAILRRTPVDHEVAVAVELLRAALRAGLPPSPQAVQELRQILGRSRG